MNSRILIVEDSPTQALRAQLLLEEAGYLTETAENGQLGLEKALEHPPDLVVADVKMPVMNGYDMTRRLKSDARTAGVPVLMLTTMGEPLDVIHGLEAGADHFVTKPYEDAQLAQRVQALFLQRAEAKAGSLPEQRVLASFGQEIIITRSREQVLLALLQATARIMGCEAMGLLLHDPDELPLFLISFHALADQVIDRLGSTMVTALARLLPGTQGHGPLRTVQIVAELDADPPAREAALGVAYMQAPLIVEGQMNGLVAVFGSEPDAFDIQHVRFLYEMGQGAAAALSRVKLDSGQANA